MSASSKTGNPVRKHKRDIWLKIFLPVALVFVVLVIVCVVLAVAVAADAVVSDQITLVMSCVATLFLALPMVVLCLVPYFLLVMSAYLAGKGYAHAQTPLRAVRDLTGKVASKTNQHVPKLAKPLVALNVRITRWEHTLRSWQQKDTDHERRTETIRNTEQSLAQKR